MKNHLRVVALRMALVLTSASLPLFAQTTTVVDSSRSDFISPADPRIQIVGRADLRDPARPRLAYPGITVRFRFTGMLAVVELTSEADGAYVEVVVEGGHPRVQRLAKGMNRVTVSAAQFGPGPHTVEVVKRTETWQGVLTFTGMQMGTDAALVAPLPLPERRLMFIGDSVTCGAGVDNYPVCPAETNRHSNAYDAYGMVLGRRLDAQAELVCYGGRGVVRDYLGNRNMQAPQFFNYSVVADDEAQRAKWTGDAWTPDAVVISLGTNDWNLQKTDPLSEEEFVSDYVGLIHDVRKHYPKAFILLTQGSINGDPKLAEYVQATVRRVNDPRVLWFASRHFPGSTCDAHPDKAQHLQIADDLEVKLRELLGW